MVRLSCFSSPSHSHKSKKQAQPSFETMIKMLKASEPRGNNSSWSDKSLKQAKVQNGLRSEAGSGNTNTTADIPQQNLRRSWSFGCASPREARDDYEENNSEENTDLDFSVNNDDQPSSIGSPNNSEAAASSFHHQDPHVKHLSSPHGCGSEKLTIETISAAYMEEEKDEEGAESVQSEIECGGGDDSSNYVHPTTQQMMSKSQSVPNFESRLRRRGSSRQFQASHSSRFHGDLKTTLDAMGKEISVEDQNEDREDDGWDSDEYAASGKDWIVPVLDDDDEEVYLDQKSSHEASSSRNLQQQIPNKNFMKKRIEDWVTDVQECAQNKEGTKKVVVDQERSPVLSMIDGRDTAKPQQLGMNPAVEAAKKYESSLSANATTAQIISHGLVVIPFLTAFVSLKVVNLSGNSIVRINAGALPRGLHMLNLSKNKITAIEGLRDLTRLRILDVSYNKITRISRGLASCSSLKELYLAGNKISEVDGLHRLLKLSVLDLRFNKISTTKGLGLLAANYNSLQAISVEGNPAQKNVGDEQLKKYLLNLLPNLVYYNRRSTNNKTVSFKDSSQRSIRSDRSHKSGRKMSRSASHSSLVTKQSGHRGQVSKRGTRGGRHGHLPPTNSSHHRHRCNQQFEMNMKPLDLTKAFSVRKSQSVGNLSEL